ncbi:response regulator [Ectothiorhodospiraceae bacterium BW-2]|nr:response regulator [Ectothiorhodospiraceae bacterium BW-2]
MAPIATATRSDLFELFPWDKNFEIGIESIDQQHQVLVSILNQLAAALIESTEAFEVDSILDELERYALYHFTTEEAIWQHHFNSGTELLQQHLQTHQNFTTTLIDLRRQRCPSLERMQQLVEFLTNWLAFHILDSDKRMVLMLQQLQQGEGLEEAIRFTNRQMDGAMRQLIEAILKMYATLSSRTMALLREKHLRQGAEQQASRYQHQLWREGVTSTLLRLATSSDSLEQVLSQALQQILSLGHYQLEHKGAIFLLNAAGKLEMVAQHQLSEELQQRCQTIEIGECLCGQAAEGRVVFASHLNEHHPIRLEQMSDHGHYCAPISYRDRVIGVLNLYLPVGHRQSVEEERYIVAITDTLGFVINYLQTDTSLKSALERMSLATDAAQIGIWETHLQQQQLILDERMNLIYDYQPPRHRLSFQQWLRSVVVEDRDIVLEALTDASRGKSPHGCVFRIQTQSGKLRWIEANFIAFYSEHGELQRLVGTNVDVTEVKQAYASLSQSVSQLNEAQRLTKIGSWMLEHRTGHLSWSEEIYRIFEIEPTAFTASYEAFLAMIHPEDRQQVDQAFTASLDLHRPYEIEHRLLMADGRVKYVYERGITRYNHNEQPVVTNGTVQDITERKQQEMALRQSEQRYRAFLDIVPTSLITVNQQGKITEINQYHISHIGNNLQSKGAYLGHRIDQHPSVVSAGLAKSYRRVLQGEPLDLQDVNFPLTTGGKSRIFNIKGTPLIVNGTVVGAIFVHEDVTERVNYQQNLQREVEARTEELRLAKEEAEAASRAKSDFLASMSHEIRTPMTAILGMTRLALKSGLPPRQANYIRKTYSSAENLLGIINDILDFSKIEAGKLELEQVSFQLNEVIGNTLNLVKFKAEERSIMLAIKIEPRMSFRYVGDPLRLTQILTNLVSNAVKFSHDGDTVTIHIASEQPPQDERVWLHFAIEDHGIGIEAEQLQRLFQSFSQAESSTSRKYGGSGLGLTIVQRLAALMQGRVWVESEPDKGSTFHVVVGLLVPDESKPAPLSGEQEREQQLHEALQRLQNRAILLVEDNEMNRELVYDIFADEGIAIDSATNGAEALTQLQQRKYDIILMDCQMPVMDGYEATRRIRQQRQWDSVVVIALTANVMQQEIDRVLAVGMSDHIPKPFDPEQMFITLAKWVERK